ncbi:MAG: hypothetical protein GMKNLPBB_00927 [Myxococcota bacterium]|nr:hypothetical protein [Myxococcota bacterium]
MKYQVEVTIDVPRDKVISLFDNPDNMKKWMKGLQSFTPLGGTPGQPGAKSQLVFLTNGRRMEMVETITVRDLPREFSGVYEAKGVWNSVRNLFEEVPGGKTRYVSEQEFRFSGFMKLFGWLMPGAFRKESMRYLQDFKNFVESEYRKG